MQARIVIDVQNEFSEKGKRPVKDHARAIEAISRQVEHAGIIHRHGHSSEVL